MRKGRGLYQKKYEALSEMKPRYHLGSFELENALKIGLDEK